MLFLVRIGITRSADAPLFSGAADIFQDFCRIAPDDRICRDVLCDDRTCADNGIFTDRDPRQDDCTGTDPDIPADPDAPAFQHIPVFRIMIGRHDRDRGPI